jgi:predicted enzyme related to lactoylglutathione lyase
MSANTICWTDIPVIKLDRAIKFYSAVLDAKVTHEKEHGFEFGLLPHHKNNASGCLFKFSKKENRPSKSGPLVYLNVNGRMDAALKAVKKARGKILVGKEQIGPYGYRAIILDTEGNRIALHSEKA